MSSMISSLSGGTMLFSSPPRYRVKACKLIWSETETWGEEWNVSTCRKGQTYLGLWRFEGQRLEDTIIKWRHVLDYKLTKRLLFSDLKGAPAESEHCGLDSWLPHRFWLNGVLAGQLTADKAVQVPQFFYSNTCRGHLIKIAADSHILDENRYLFQWMSKDLRKGQPAAYKSQE